MNRKELREIIERKWNTSYWMRINGFLFFTDECYCKFTTCLLIIFDKETKRKLTSIIRDTINSLEIDDEVIL